MKNWYSSNPLLPVNDPFGGMREVEKMTSVFTTTLFPEAAALDLKKQQDRQQRLQPKKKSQKKARQQEAGEVWHIGHIHQMGKQGH